MEIKNSLTEKTPKKETFSSFLTAPAAKGKISQMLHAVDVPRFIMSLVSTVSANPTLAECDYSTILSAALIGESLKLAPSPQLGQFYLIPYNDTKNNRKVCTFQIGYKGYLQLAIRSGKYKKLNVLVIKEGELVAFDPLTETLEVNLIQDEVLRETTPTIGYYAMFEYTNGFEKAIYWSKKKMESHALKYSKGYSAKKGYTFWEKDFDSMALKTMLRQIISKWGIMNVDMQIAIEKDQAVIVNDKVEFIDNGNFKESAIDVEYPVQVDSDGKIINFKEK